MGDGSGSERGVGETGMGVAVRGLCWGWEWQ